jgi:UDP-glucose 4-epimerase
LTGGAGFIGSHLAERLLRDGHHVCVMDDLSTGVIGNLQSVRQDKHLKVRIGSVLEADLVNELIRDADMIYHLASAVGVKLIMEKPVETIERIVLGTDIVLKYASRYRVPTLLTSTSEVYGKSQNVPFREDGDRLEGPTHLHRWAYACAKAMDEFMALAHYKTTGLPVVIVRLFNTVGPRQSGQYGMVLPRFCKAALANEPLHVHSDGLQSRSFTHVYDVVEALVAIMQTDKAHGQVFNIGSSEETSILDLAKLVIDLAKSRSEIRFMPYAEAFPGGGFEDMQRRVPCTEKIQAAIGWVPTRDMRQIVKDVLADLSGGSVAAR